MQSTTQLQIATEKPGPTGDKGITFSGVTFTVPVTRDVIETLFDPTIPKSNFELIVLVILTSNIVLFYILPSSVSRISAFTILYIFWRLSYNFGIGYLLRSQSNLSKLVGWARDLRLFDPKNKSILARTIQAEITSQRGELYDISLYPIDFNTWLVFRKVVDLILMLDFTTFVCLVAACAFQDNYQFVTSQSFFPTVARLIVGGALILFNLWVKVNAHNTIKDYAWYWGDFFFRQINNEELIFDGVFEMVPHPMYSVGYIGYYGFALIAKSYTVLVVAIFGHFLQMIFLHYIENPHIDKLYGPSPNEVSWAKLSKLKDLQNFDNLKPLVGLSNFNWLRALDSMNLVMVGTYAVLIPVTLAFAGNSTSPRLLFFLTLCIKLAELIGINGMLLAQSKLKYFTKWFLSKDIPVLKSLNNWAVFYNSMLNLSYASLIGMNLYRFFYYGSLDKDVVFSNYFYLRCFLGVGLIATQIWVNVSIIDLIGYFGWFFGDFFIPRSQRQSTHLTKAGVYRYLNNPEQFFGVCGVMGLSLAVSLWENMVCAALWFASNFFRINVIEKPHMIKIYGEQEVAQDSGVTKTFKRHLLPELIQRKLQQEIDRTDRKHRGSLVDSMESFIKELRALPKAAADAPVHPVFESSQYQLSVLGLECDQLVSIKSLTVAQLPKYAHVGAPLVVEWQGPTDPHSPEDWIGIYKCNYTSYSRSRTVVSSQGRWTWCQNAEGSAKFSDVKLPWHEGVYEFRYHIGGTHDVAFISEPFELRVEHIEVPTTPDSVADFSSELKSKIFDKWLDLESVNTRISQSVCSHDDALSTYKALGYIISTSTGIKISSKTFMFDDENLTVARLAQKLMSYKLVLDELENGGVEILLEKKEL